MNRVAILEFLLGLLFLANIAEAWEADAAADRFGKIVVNIVLNEM